ncbi:Leucine-rich repeat [Macleaya cordata]|uniref:Leucine-rich repeat n=1 Tax=Macleaya cordata TaxID=56857 RepID=A0A200QQ37_MACCD|nr:Leucine-rich repeat [Macleaya cordata]
MSFLSLLFFFSLNSTALSQPSPPKGTLIDCGATNASVIEGQQWLPDTDYISAGVPKTLTIPNILPILSTVRSFPLGDGTPRKFCYVVPVFRNGKYLIRTTYYYGGINGRDSPPVFDQIVDGTIWSVVNTTDDYARGLSSYYEGVFVARGKMMSLCIGVNSYTDSDPFISALEFVILGDSLYNSTDFTKYGLSLVSRSNFGYGGSIIKFPDDPFDRYWEPFGDSNPIIQSTRNVSASDFWNLPPSKVFDTELTTDQAKPMELQWPLVSLPKSFYYISLYFAGDRDISVGSSRIFDIHVNGIEYYRNLNVTPAGVVVFATRWPLSGLTKITLTPAAGSDVGPLINAGEVFNVLLLGGRTITRDVIALERLKNSLQNPPADWNGDPCIPRQYSWAGVKCSKGIRIRVVSLNLSNMGLSGSISPSIANLTALTKIWLGNNNLTGPIPDLSSLKWLETLHLENNQLNGTIPPSLGDIGSLRELFIQNNYLTGEVPNNLKRKPGLNLKISPGNRFSFATPSSRT